MDNHWFCEKITKLDWNKASCALCAVKKSYRLMSCSPILVRVLLSRVIIFHMIVNAISSILSGSSIRLQTAPLLHVLLMETTFLLSFHHFEGRCVACSSVHLSLTSVASSPVKQRLPHQRQSTPIGLSMIVPRSLRGHWWLFRSPCYQIIFLVIPA